MIKVSKNIFFKIIGSHHTLSIIAICKTIVTTEPIYKTYCGVYPLLPDFEALNNKTPNIIIKYLLWSCRGIPSEILNTQRNSKPMLNAVKYSCKKAPFTSLVTTMLSQQNIYVECVCGA